MEDNQIDVLVIREMVENADLNLNLLLMSDGEQAIRYLDHLEKNPAAELPALMLLDLNVPRFSGIEILERLRNGSRTSRVPVIVVTSSMAERDRVVCEDFGVDGYFKKATTLTAYSELRTLIREVLS